MKTSYKIALAGNPNSGKSSLFNALTGLNQKVGNFPGVTVDKKTGFTTLDNNLQAKIIDLPGTYSLYPKSADEYVAYKVLLNTKSEDHPDLIIVVADATNLKRSLLFCSQAMDLKTPVILALTMMDLAESLGISINIAALEQAMGITIVAINPRHQKGINALKSAIVKACRQPGPLATAFIPAPAALEHVLPEIKKQTGAASDYAALHLALAGDRVAFIPMDNRIRVQSLLQQYSVQKGRIQAEEVVQRYEKITRILEQTVSAENSLKTKQGSARLDKILLHKIWGNVILLLVLLLMFQCLFWLADFPMQWIEGGFSGLQHFLSGLLPETWWSDLLLNGVIAGIGGIVIFVPQIALLFGMISLLEDSGYMARISFLSDRIMRSAGLNGRSVMPLISGMACAIPAVMAARTIENPKERLITILVTPLMSCAARLPVYVILIALLFPGQPFLQGLVMTGMYLLGFVMALIVAKVLSWVMRKQEAGVFLMELPAYRAPRWKNAAITMYEKSKIFVTDAGKIILLISVILWALASYGPPAAQQQLEERYAMLGDQAGWTEDQQEQYATDKLEHSYAGLLGKAIEPAIRPLGYDWKIGIALLSSFAAREVFVGTMATLYSVGDADEYSQPLREKMTLAHRPDGTKVYTMATGISLMIFYAFAMQCMSTIAIVKRETRRWKWALIQLAYMTGLAYLAALLVYQLLK